jgi:hypothetical protein
MADDTLTVEQATEQLLDAIRAGNVPLHPFINRLVVAAAIAGKACTCGNMQRAGGRYGHLNWCPLWVNPVPESS